MAKRVPYLVGNTRGRDVQNWPTKTRAWVVANASLSPSQMNDQYVADITRDQLLAVTWRVRKWKLTGSAAGALHIAIGTPHIFSAAVTIGTPGFYYPVWGYPSAAAIADKETQLISDSFGDFDGISAREGELVHGSGPFGITADFPSLHYAASDNFGNSWSANQQTNGAFNSFYVLFNDDGTFTPDMFSILNVAFNPSGGPRYSIKPSRSPTTSLVFSSVSHTATASGGGTITVKSGIADDFVIPVQCQFIAGFSPGTDTGSTGSASCDFTLTATEFWPYTNRLGQLCYDTATGIQINDPLA